LEERKEKGEKMCYSSGVTEKKLWKEAERKERENQRGQRRKRRERGNMKKN